MTVPKLYVATSSNNAIVEIYCELPLTRGYIAKVSPEDYARVACLPWFALVTKGGVYAAYKPSYSKKTILLHRLILDAPPGVLVDHVRRDEKLNCTRENLRMANNCQNAWNSKHPVGRHGFIGVVSTKTPDRYMGAVCANGRRHYTKVCSSAILAAAARDVLAKELHGDFAVLNFQFIPVEVRP